MSASRESLSDRLGQWLDWTHAVALSTALDGKPAVVDAGVPTPVSAEEIECARVRSSLANAIAGDPVFATSVQRDAAEAGAPGVAEYAPFRQRYLAIQRSMQAATGNLRGRLRDVLAETTAGMARLAAVDAVMEQALSPREQMLLAAVPDPARRALRALA